MRNYAKNIVLIFISVVVFLFIFIIDTAFYHLPSFIRIYRYEREIAVLIAFLIFFPVLKKYFRYKKLSLQSCLIVLGVSNFFILISIFLPQLILRKHLVLWGNNPFLAENPLVWNIVSTVCAIWVVLALICQLLAMWELVALHQDQFGVRVFRILIVLIVGVSIGLNLVEDRFSYEPIEAFYMNPGLRSLTLIGLIIVVFVLNSIHKPWIDVLSKRHKLVVFLFLLIVVPLTGYAYLSRFMTPVFSYSVSVKWFSIMSLGYLIFYGALSNIGLLFRLPTAEMYDRVTKDMSSFALVNQMISEKHSAQEIISTITLHALKSTKSDACWLELQDIEGQEWTTPAAINLSREAIEVLPRIGLSHIVKETKDSIFIHDTGRDERGHNLRLYNLPWRSVIAVPLMKKGEVRGILYVCKNSRYGYRSNNLKTIEMFVHQTQIVLDTQREREGEAEAEESPAIEASDRLETGSREFNRNLIPKLDCVGIDIIDICNERIVPFWDFFSSSEGKVLFINVICYRAGDRNGLWLPELRGIVHTLFRIENAVESILLKALEILGEKEIQPRPERMFVGEMDLASGIVTLTTQEDIVIIHYKTMKNALKIYELAGLQGDFKGVSEPNTVALNLLPEDRLLVLNSDELYLNTDSLKEVFSDSSAENLIATTARLESVICRQNENKIVMGVLIERYPQA